AAVYERGPDMLTVWGATKMVHRTRTVLAGLLGRPEHRVRLVETDVGGGVGWLEDRREHFLATNHSRQQWHEVEIGFTPEGRFLALVDTAFVDMGAYLRPNGFVAPDRTAAFLPGPYVLEHFAFEVRCVFTDKVPVGSYRGPGR